METSTITVGGQADIPDDVLAALGLVPGDAIRWTIAGGEVTVTKADPLDDLFANHLVPTPEGFTAEGGVEAMSRLTPANRLALLQQDIAHGRASGISDRSLSDILSDHRVKRG